MLFINVFLLLTIGLITAILIWLRRHFTYWSRHGVPGPNFFEWKGFVTIHHDWTVQQIKTYGRVYGAYDFHRKGIIINEPDLIRDIMTKDFHIFPHHKMIYTGSSKLSQSLFFMPGNDDWKRVRSILSPTFTSGKLKTMMRSISDISDKFVVNLEKFTENGEPIDMRKYVGAFAMDVISACAYGIRVDSIDNPNHPIVVNAKSILNIDGNLSLAISVLAAPIAKILKLEPFSSSAAQYFDDLTNKLIEERKKSNISAEKCDKRSDFLQLMIDTEKQESEIESISDDESFSAEDSEKTSFGSDSQKSNRTLTLDEMTAQGILFFIAGYDTTSAAISHGIYYLSQYKDVQQKLYEELKTVNDFSYESLNKLEYLNAIIKETLRLAPSLTRIQRECIKDYKLGNTGITIPAGTSIEILPFALHRDPEFFPEPEVFRPERFISSSDEPTHHPYAYIPFGGGPRLCIGMRFALNEMRMCLGKLFHKFEFSLAPDFEVSFNSEHIFSLYLTFHSIKDGLL